MCSCVDHVCIYTCTYMSLYVYTHYTDACLSLYIYRDAYMYLLICVCTDIYIYTYAYEYTYVYLFISVYVHTYLSIFTYIYMYMEALRTPNGAIHPAVFPAALSRKPGAGRRHAMPDDDACLEIQNQAFR